MNDFELKSEIDIHTLVRAIIGLGCFAIVVICVWLGIEVKAYHNASQAYDDIQKVVIGENRKVTTYSVSDNGTSVSTDAPSNTIELPTVNFKELTNINQDVIAWIYIPYLDLSYPVVRSHDNIDYVDVDFKKNSTKAGSIFSDCRIAFPFYEQTILYGHNMKDGTMFGNLFELENIDTHPDVYVILPNGYVFNYKLDYTLRTTKADSSIYDVTPDGDIRKLFLSTCVKDEKRFVVVCTLVGTSR